MLKEAIRKSLRLQWIAPSGEAEDVGDEPMEDDLYYGKYKYVTRNYSPNRQTRRGMGLRRRPRRMKLARLAGKVAA